LSSDEQRAVQAARAAALAALRGEVDPRLQHGDRLAIGLPDPRLGRALLDQLGAVLGLRA
jgi:hypothetical protein